MDINDFRGIITAIALLAFLGLCVWAWSSRRKTSFDESARLPLEKDEYITDNKRENG